MSRAVAERRYWLRHYLDDLTLRLSALFVLAFVLMPPEGLGWELCICKRLTDAPCPACGFTRSGSNLVRGHFLRAIEYHPFGPLLIPVIVALGLLALAPRRWRQALRDALLQRGERFRPVYRLLFGAFMVYGILRWCLVLAGWCSFPATWP
jgi:hypothetical protein